MMSTTDRYGSVVFGVLGLLFSAGAIMLIKEAYAIRSWPLASFSMMALGAAALLVYETVALNTTLPTLSWLTNQEFVIYPVVFLAIYAVLTYGLGLLAAHFTYSHGYHWGVLFLGLLTFVAGFITSVVFKWIPLA